jgi:hypothetical protein
MTGETDETGGWGGAGDAVPEPNRRRVEEKRREGNRRVEANWKLHESTYRTRYVRGRCYIFVPICDTFFHPRHKTHRDKLPNELGSLLDVLLVHVKRVHFVWGPRG